MIILYYNTIVLQLLTVFQYTDMLYRFVAWEQYAVPYSLGV